jgi:Tol biopolymer transport system component
VISDDGTEVRVIARKLDYYQWPSCSPDRRWIAFQSRPDRSSERITEAIYLIRPDGTGLRRLTDMSTSDGYPAWSPDSSRIAYSAGERLSVMNAGGSDPVVTHLHPAATGHYHQRPCPTNSSSLRSITVDR